MEHETKNDDDDDDKDSYVDADSIEWRNETRSVDDEVAEILATDFPHLIEEQSPKLQSTQELLHLHVERIREIHTAFEANEKITNRHV